VAGRDPTGASRRLERRIRERVEGERDTGEGGGGYDLSMKVFVLFTFMAY
jgi:hypothetical protein